MIDQQVIAFTIAAAILAVTPGNDTVLVMKNALSSGPRAGLATIAGIVSGCVVHGLFSALGISVILVNSAALFNFVKLAGAGYLLFLGVQTLWRLWRTRQNEAAVSVEIPRGSKRVRRAFGEGFLTNVLNPKVAIFYLSFLPQFISPENSVFERSLLLTAIHQVLGTLWLCCVVLFVTRLQGFLSRASVRRKLEALTGAVLIAFGLKLAVEQQR